MWAKLCGTNRGRDEEALEGPHFPYTGAIAIAIRQRHRHPDSDRLIYKFGTKRK